MQICHFPFSRKKLLNQFLGCFELKISLFLNKQMPSCADENANMISVCRSMCHMYAYISSFFILFYFSQNSIFLKWNEYKIHMNHPSKWVSEREGSGRGRIRRKLQAHNVVYIKKGKNDRRNLRGETIKSFFLCVAVGWIAKCVWEWMDKNCIFGWRGKRVWVREWEKGKIKREEGEREKTT